MNNFDENISCFDGKLLSIRINRESEKEINGKSLIDVKRKKFDVEKERFSLAKSSIALNIAHSPRALCSAGLCAERRLGVRSLCLLFASSAPSQFLMLCVDQSLRLRSLTRYDAASEGLSFDCVGPAIVFDGPGACLLLTSHLIVFYDGSVFAYSLDKTFQSFNCLVSDEYLVVILWTSPTNRLPGCLMKVCISLTEGRKLNEFNCQLIPSFYSGVVMCLRICDLEIISESSIVEIHGSVVVCTSYGQLVEFKRGKLSACVQLPFQDGCCIEYVGRCLHQSLVVVRSLGKSCCVVNLSSSQVIFVLESVGSVFVGDFVGNGYDQLLLLRAQSDRGDSDDDVVSMIDFEVNGNDERFLLTDFQGIHVHRWTSSAARSEGEQREGGCVDSHQGAMDALGSRLVVGRTLVNEMNRLCSRKLRLIEETCEAMKKKMLGQSLVSGPRSLLLISLVGNRNEPENFSQNSKSESLRTKANELATGDVWQRIFNKKLVFGVRVHNQTNRSVGFMKLCLSSSNPKTPRLRRHDDVTVHSRCFMVVPNGGLCESSLPPKRPKTQQSALNDFKTSRVLKDVVSVHPNEEAHVTGFADLPAFSPFFGTLAFNVILTWREEGEEDAVESSAPGKMQLSRTVGKVTLNAEEVEGRTENAILANGSSSDRPRAELDDLLTFHSVQISQCVRISSAFGRRVPDVLDSLRKDFGFRFLEDLGCFVCLEPRSRLFCARVEILSALCSEATLNVYAANLSQYSSLLHLMLKDLPPGVGVANGNEEEAGGLAESLLLRLQQESLSTNSSGSSSSSREPERKNRTNGAPDDDDARKRTDFDLVKRSFESRKEKYLKDEISETKADGWKSYEAKLQTDRQLIRLTERLSVNYSVF